MCYVRSDNLNFLFFFMVLMCIHLENEDKVCEMSEISIFSKSKFKINQRLTHDWILILVSKIAHFPSFCPHFDGYRPLLPSFYLFSDQIDLFLAVLDLFFIFFALFSCLFECTTFSFLLSKWLIQKYYHLPYHQCTNHWLISTFYLISKDILLCVVFENDKYLNVKAYYQPLWKWKWMLPT